MFLLKNSTRREIKFKVFIKDVGKLYSWILKSSFKKSFSNRGVNSLYYDTPNLDFANENIIGLSKRIKIRARWYSNNCAKDTSVTTSPLQTKKSLLLMLSNFEIHPAVPNGLSSLIYLIFTSNFFPLPKYSLIMLPK